jgi:protein O-GlcNAc transferase
MDWKVRNYNPLIYPNKILNIYFFEKVNLVFVLILSTAWSFIIPQAKINPSVESIIKAIFDLTINAASAAETPKTDSGVRQDTTTDSKLDSEEINNIVSRLINIQRINIENKDQQVKDLSEVVTKLSQDKGILGNKAQVDNALQSLMKGDVTPVKALLASSAKQVDQKAREGAQIFLNLGALADPDNPSQALSSYRRGTELDPDNFIGWDKFGHLLERTGDLDDAFNAYTKLKILGEAHQNQDELSQAYSNLGSIYKIRGELESASDHYLRALSIDKSLNNKNRMATDYVNLGNIALTRGDLEQAASYFQQALKINESLDKSSALSGLADIYLIRGELGKAEEIYQKALALAKQSNNKLEVAEEYENLGDVYLTRGKMDPASEYYQKALTLDESLAYKQGIAEDYDNLGDLYLIRGDKSKAEVFYHKALAINEALGYKEGMAEDYHNIGNVQLNSGKINNAVKFYQKALSIEQNLSNDRDIAEIYESLALAFRKQGHKKQARQANLASLRLYRALGNQTKALEIACRVKNAF